MQPPFPKHSRNARASQMRFIAPCFGYALPQNDTPYRFESLTRYSRFDTSPYCPHVRANASIITQAFFICKSFFQKPKEKEKTAVRLSLFFIPRLLFSSKNVTIGSNEAPIRRRKEKNRA